MIIITNKFCLLFHCKFLKVYLLKQQDSILFVVAEVSFQLLIRDTNKDGPSTRFWSVPVHRTVHSTRINLVDGQYRKSDGLVVGL